jgi:lysyl endopeptidase
MRETAAVRNRCATLVAALLVILGAALAAQTTVLAQERYPEAPARVVTEGMTAAQHLQRQADLSQQLLGELPSAAERASVPLTLEETSAIDAAPRPAVPLQIGLVKAVAPGIEVRGLARGPSDRQAGRRTGVLAYPARDGGLVWAAIVTSENAGAIRLHIEDMSLPRNAELYLYSRSGAAYGPYAGAGVDGTGEFWTATVFGPEAILQLRISSPVSDEDLRAVSFRVVEAGLITPRYAGSLQASPRVQAPPPPGWPCGNPNCVVDASCYNTTIADALSLAVAKMEWVQGAFLYSCSGGLISDNNPSQDNFFLTANHCVSRNNNAKNVNFYWRFATSSCNGSSCPSNAGWPYQTSGSTVAGTDRKGDFSLLHLNSAPPSGSVTLGWTAAPVANSNGTQLFRVSNPNFGPQVYSEHKVDTGAPTCSSWPRGERIYSRDIVGAIDGGSSGSPIVNGSAQIVGQLSGTCGFNPSNPCSSGPGEDNATVDGAFSFYFSLVQPIINP